MNPASSVWSMTLAAFREAVISRSTPGCGAAAAATADIGLALVMKGLRISESRQHDPQRRALIEKADALRDDLGAYADEDMTAFEAYMAALRLPKSSEQEKQRRQQALGEAGVRINQVPLVTAKACLEALELAVQALPLVDAWLRSDVIGGGFLLHSGLSSVLLNVDANLASLQDTGEREAVAKTRNDLQARADDRIGWLREQGDRAGQ